MKPALDTIHTGDCVEIMHSLPPMCADLIFADPPYNLQLRQKLHRPDRSLVDAVDDHWDQFASLQEYDAFTREWLSACRRVLKSRGTIWVIGTYHNIHRVGAILQDLGYWILNDIAWVKLNPMPQFHGVRFCNAHETLIWAKRDERATGYTFNYHALKAGNDDLQLRSDWYLPICQGSERLRQAGEKAHATQKPEALLNRIIRACSNPGDVVLDPFFGSGTTGAVAKRLRRRFIGIEREEAYVRVAAERIAAVTPAPEEGFIPEPTPPLRVPFAALLELGLIREGDPLYTRDLSEPAFVQADGTIALNGYRGSIHAVGARALGTEKCNGWTTWRFRSPETGRLELLDILRDRAREILGAERVEA